MFCFSYLYFWATFGQRQSHLHFIQMLQGGMKTLLHHYESLKSYSEILIKIYQIGAGKEALFFAREGSPLPFCLSHDSFLVCCFCEENHDGELT